MAAETPLRKLLQTTVAEDHRPIGGAVHIVKERHAGNEAVFAVSFEDRGGTQRRGIIGFRQHADGSWHAAGSFTDTARSAGPGQVWTTWGGWSAGQRPENAVRGGWVADPGAVSARLVDAAGRILEDEVENGVALFLFPSSFDLLAARVELLSADNEVIRSAPVQPYVPSR
jgi:hypothetical protein